MATAISIQHQVGGNLAEILDSIAYTIRERVRIKGEIRTLTAQQRLSGYVVAGLPIGLAAFLFVFSPGFMSPMFMNPPAILGLPAGVVILMMGGFNGDSRGAGGATATRLVAGRGRAAVAAGVRGAGSSRRFPTTLPQPTSTMIDRTAAWRREQRTMTASVRIVGGEPGPGGR